MSMSVSGLQKMKSWIPGQAADLAEEEEDEATTTEVAEQIAAVDLELQQLQFEMKAELDKEEEAKKQRSR